MEKKVFEDRIEEIKRATGWTIEQIYSELMDSLDDRFENGFYETDDLEGISQEMIDNDYSKRLNS